MDTKALRQKILDLAIRGKLVPQDPNDEPASVLLERIREQKQQMLKEGKLKKKDIKNDSIIFKGEDNLHYEQFQNGTVKCIEDEIPFEVPEGWAWCRLKQIGNIVGGGTPKTNIDEYWNGNIPWISPTDLSGYTDMYISCGARKITEKGLYKSSAQLMPKGTILYSSRAPIGYVAIAKNTITTNQGFKSVVPYIGIISEYIYYCLIARTENIVMRATGTTFKEISGSQLAETLIPIPPSLEQLEISKYASQMLENISYISGKQDEMQNIIKLVKNKILDLAIRGKLVPQDTNDEPASVLLERIRLEKEELIKQGKIKRDKRESIIFKGEDNSYYEKIGNEIKNIDSIIPFVIPDTWQWCRGFSCFAGMESKKPSGEYFDYIDIDSIDNHLHKIKEAKHLLVSEAPSRANRAVCKGSVLFSLVRPYLENIALIEEEYTNCIVSTGFYVCNSSGILHPEYMFFLMISGYVINGLNHYMKGDNSPSISKDNIEKWLYPVPPINEQRTICQKLKIIFTKIETIEKSLN